MEPTTLLLIDDDPEARTIYGDYLRGHGYRVLSAQDAEEGIGLAEAERPAVVIMDLSLPKVDGCTATRILKSKPETAQIPVVAATASDLDADRRKALDAGCDAFLDKPCTPPRLLRELERWIRPSGA